jgi:rubrerythrin
MMDKVKVFYPAGQHELEAEIKKLEKKELKKRKQLEELRKETLVGCPKCKSTAKISDLEGTAHMYYVDNVYTGYYALSEYSYVCPICNVKVRDYDSPELQSLRNYYGSMTAPEEKD